MSYTVKLINFVGPLDLLLQLIQKQDLDITEVSLSIITADYLEHIEGLEVDVVDLDWFSQVASKLVLLKSQTIAQLPKNDEEESAENQLSELADQLREYQVYNAASQDLQALMKNEQFARPTLSKLEVSSLEHKNITTDELNLTLERLLLSKYNKKYHSHTLIARIPIAEKTYELKKLLMKPSNINDILSPTQSQRELIGNLLALLELIKQKTVILRQTEDGLVATRAEIV